jgi:hypothetical protein
MKYFYSIILLFSSALTYAQYVGSGSVSQGLATTTITNLYPGCAGGRVSGVGTITSTDGKVWTIPSPTNYSTGLFLPDLYNQCNGVTPANIAAVNLASIPTTVIDPGGTVITGYIFGDNYYELYINGTLVGVDPVPYTPFNSSVVKFQVNYPYTIAVKLVDWEENLGVGTELNGGNPYHSGDGGFIASFSDGTVTNSNWKAQTYYIAPVQDLTTIVELADSTRSSATALTTTTCNSGCYAVHYSVPSAWNTPAFDDSHWPNATVFSSATVGVGGILAFTNFPTLWASSSFIWSSNLILDNLVLVRHTVLGPTSINELKSEQLNIELFPNPTNNGFALNLNGIKESDIQSISILSIVGEVVYRSEKYKQYIDIHNLSQGTYFVNLKLINGSVTKKLIVK